MQQEALAALQAAVALAPDDPASLYSLGLMQVVAPYCILSTERLWWQARRMTLLHCTAFTPADRPHETASSVKERLSWRLQ